MSRILLISVPRSGSSYLRCNIDGCNAIFGELMLPHTSDPAGCFFQNAVRQGVDAWVALERLPYCPSHEPGEPSQEPQDGCQRGRNVLGMKVMVAELFRSPQAFVQLVLGADLLVFLFPSSFMRQWRSLSRIVFGAYAHDYYGAKARKRVAGCALSFRAGANIAVSDALHRAIFLLALMVRTGRVVWGNQKHIDRIQDTVSSFCRRI